MPAGMFPARSGGLASGSAMLPRLPSNRSGTNILAGQPGRLAGAHRPWQVRTCAALQCGRERAKPRGAFRSVGRPCFAICAFAEGLWHARSSDCREASPDVGLHGLMRAFGRGLKRRCGPLVPFMAQGPLAQAQGPLYQNNGRGRRRFRRCASREAI